MRALAITPGKADSARLTELPRPVPPSGGALVKVLEIGLCGTDMELTGGIIGRAPAGEDFLVIGHESLGVVEETGDLVVAMVRRPDDCPNCRAGEPDMCVKGQYTERGIFGEHGFFAEYYADHENFLVKVPQELRGVGVLLEPMSVVEKAVRHAWEIQRRLRWEPRQALVLGAGTVGLLVAFLLRLRGLEVAVYSREPRSSRRVALLERAGAQYFTELPGKPDFDFMVEATGAAPLLVAGPALLRANGVMAYLGICPSHDPIPVAVGPLNNRAVQSNHLLFGSVNANRKDFEQGVRDFETIEQRWPGLLPSLFTRREPLDRFERAFHRTEEDIKVVVAMPS